MGMEPQALLRSVADALRQRIGPAVGEPFAKTQAFMAAVVLEKLAGELDGAPGRRAAADAERIALVDALQTTAPPSRVADALARLSADGGDEAWNALVRALYAERDALGVDGFDAALGRVRAALRARLDRALEYSA